MERRFADVAVVPTPEQTSGFFRSFNKFFPFAVVIGGLIGGNWIYKFKDEFKDDLFEEMDERFIQVEAADDFTPQIMFDVFKTRTNSAISDVKSKSQIHEAIVDGVLDRVERDVAEIKTDLKELIRANK